MQIYHQTHKVCEANLGKGLEEDEHNALINMTVHCHLCQAITNPDLDHFFTKARIAAPSVGTYYHEGHDHYFPHYSHTTMPKPELPAYGDRPGMAYTSLSTLRNPS